MTCSRSGRAHQTKMKRHTCGSHGDILLNKENHGVSELWHDEQVGATMVPSLIGMDRNIPRCKYEKIEHGMCPGRPKGLEPEEACMARYASAMKIRLRLKDEHGLQVKLER